MRCVLALLVLVASATTASPRVVMRRPDPPIIAKCAKAATWEALTTCIGKVGKLQVIKKLPAAAIVHYEGVSSNGRGLYLYMQNAASEWVMAGVYERGFEQYELLKLEPVKVGKRTIYRFAVGESVATYVSLDDVTSAPALVRDVAWTYCDGADRYSCMQITTDCDVYVRGKVYWTFHGNVTLEGKSIHVRGDRSLQGSYCSIPERVELGFEGLEIE